MGNGNPFYGKPFIQSASIFYIVTSSQANLIYRHDICCKKPLWAQQHLVCQNWLDKTNLWSLSTCEKYFKLYNLTMNRTINNGNIGKFYNTTYRRYVGLIVSVWCSTGRMLKCVGTAVICLPLSAGPETGSLETARLFVCSALITRAAYLSGSQLVQRSSGTLRFSLTL